MAELDLALTTQPTHLGSNDMARIRTIKPEFPHSESMGHVSRESRLCFIMLWTIADDAGRLRGNSRMLASLLFPYDDDAKDHIDGWLAQLSKEGCIAQYEVNGTSYIQIENWGEHQKIDKPSASKIPEFDESSRTIANPREVSPLDKDLDLDLGKEGKGKDAEAAASRAPRATRSTAAEAAPPLTLSDLITEGVDKDHAAAWLRVRKEKRASLTQVAWDGLKTQASKAGISPGQAVHICAIKGWQSFDSTWRWQGVIDGCGAPALAPAGLEGETPEQKAARREAGRRLAFGNQPMGDVIDA